MNTLRFIIGIFGFAVALVRAEPESFDFSPAKVQEQIQHLLAQERSERLHASEYLSAWAEKEPELAKKQLLTLMRESKEPEIRERSLQLLKPIAAREYGRFGDGYMGISMGEEIMVKVPNEEKPCFGMTVNAVTKASPAEKAGIQAGDVIVAVNDQRWREALAIQDLARGLSAAIRAVGAGNTPHFGVWRNNELLSIDVTLTRRPGNIEMMPMQILPNGGIKVDEADLQKLVEEEKNSSAYFNEWLERQWNATPAK